MTGRTLEQIAGSEDHVWNSKDTAKGKAWYRQNSKSGPEKAAPQASQPPASAKDFSAHLTGLPKETQPAFIKPQLAQEAEKAPVGAGWFHELKLDGYRMQARKDGSRVQIFTRSGLDWTTRVPSIATAVRDVRAEKVTLDGEVVVVSENGTTNFADLQAAFQDGDSNPLTYFCFDLLHLDGHSTRDLPLSKRKALLTEVLADSDPATLRVSEHLETDGQEMFRCACELHAEGIVSKRSASKYTSGRGGDWLKLKCLQEQEFVIGGYTLPSNGIRGVGALLLGYYEGDKLIYAGRTGTASRRRPIAPSAKNSNRSRPQSPPSKLLRQRPNAAQAGSSLN